MPTHPLKIDQDLCIQCGTCVASYPELFEFSEDGTKVRVKKDADFSGKDLQKIKETCPSLAIVDSKEKKMLEEPDPKEKP